MDKTKVYLWTKDVEVVSMESGYVRPCDEGVFSGSLENVCTVMQAMMPSNDMDKLVHLVTETVLTSLDSNMTYGDSLVREIESRVYTAIMEKSLLYK